MHAVNPPESCCVSYGVLMDVYGDHQLHDDFILCRVRCSKPFVRLGFAIWLSSLTFAFRVMTHVRPVMSLGRFSRSPSCVTLCVVIYIAVLTW